MSFPTFPTLTPLPKCISYSIDDIRYVTEEYVIHLNDIQVHNQRLFLNYIVEMSGCWSDRCVLRKKEVVQLQKELDHEKWRNDTNKKTYETYVKDYEKKLKSQQEFYRLEARLALLRTE